MARTAGSEHDAASETDEFGRLVAPRDEDTDEGPRHGRARRRYGWIGWLLGFVLVLALLGGGGLYAAYTVFPEQVKSLFGWSNDYTGSGSGEVQVVIRPGDLGSNVATTLADKGVTKTYSAFYDLLVKTQPEPSLQPGTYRLKHHMSAAAALAALQNPASRLISSVTLPEGLTAKQVLSRTAAATGIPLSDLQDAVKDPTQYGVPKSAPNIEGWLFPATYQFQPKTTAHAVIQTMVTRTVQALDSAGVDSGDRQRVLTLAGLVQKEGNGEDDAKVARVFLNRLKTGMHLQSDATVSYGVGSTTVTTTAKQRAANNGYNTYLHAGLPVGPISNPGDAAIAAALHPAKGSWLYFVTVNLKTGETVFSNTLAQHETAVLRFQKWIRANPDYAK